MPWQAYLQPDRGVIVTHKISPDLHHQGLVGVDHHPATLQVWVVYGWTYVKVVISNLGEILIMILI